jgi:hypothetical protein
MGCSASRGVNPIDASLLQALIEAKQKRGRHGLTFNELLLKFPKASCCVHVCVLLLHLAAAEAGPQAEGGGGHSRAGSCQRNCNSSSDRVGRPGAARSSSVRHPT